MFCRRDTPILSPMRRHCATGGQERAPTTGRWVWERGEAPPARLERATKALGGPCSIHLSYGGSRFILSAWEGRGQFLSSKCRPPTRVSQLTAHLGAGIIGLPGRGLPLA